MELKEQELLEVYQKEVDELRGEVSKYRVALAGCLVAAEGGTENPAQEGDYGWSPTYQTVLDLRKIYELKKTESRQLKSKVREQTQVIQDLQDQIDWLRESLKLTGIKGLDGV